MIYTTIFLREKKSTDSALAEFGFIPKGAIGKTVGLSYKPEAQLWLIQQ
jgi:hypothetical protein